MAFLALLRAGVAVASGLRGGMGEGRGRVKHRLLPLASGCEPTGSPFKRKKNVCLSVVCQMAVCPSAVRQRLDWLSVVSRRVLTRSTAEGRRTYIYIYI